jgi:hypothetical protein
MALRVNQLFRGSPRLGAGCIGAGILLFSGACRNGTATKLLDSSVTSPAEVRDTSPEAGDTAPEVQNTAPESLDAPADRALLDVSVELSGTDRPSDLAVFDGSVYVSMMEVGNPDLRPLDIGNDRPYDLGAEAQDAGSMDLPTQAGDVGVTAKDALLERMCWGDGLAKEQTLADPATSVRCSSGTLQPCQFPVTFVVFQTFSAPYCTAGTSPLCIADFFYVPPFQAGGQSSCLLCAFLSAAYPGTTVRFVVRVPPNPALDYRLACPPSATSPETRFLVWSYDNKALYRIAGTDQMITITSVDEVDRSVYDQWAAAP